MHMMITLRAHLLLTCISLLICTSLLSPVGGVSRAVHAHGGVPRVLELRPPTDPSLEFWVIDTLGLFRGTRRGELSNDAPLSEQRAWSWLCDDAVDPTLGVDSLALLRDGAMVATARSGVYRSRDRGCSFERLISPINEYAIGALSVHPSDQSQIALFTETIGRDNSVWWSADKGQTCSPSDLTVEGNIKSMWRDPSRPNELWVSHTWGIAQSTDGGRTFTPVAVEDYGLDVMPSEVRLLAGGRLDERLLLWASVDRFPLASLLISEDGGKTWREIHRVEDSYDQLALTPEALWVSTPFEGLFVYPISAAERDHTSNAWRGFWRQHSATFVSCLIADPLDSSALWACGRAEPTGWIVARSRDLGASWEILMSAYAEAVGGDWGCASTSSSVIACAQRCLEVGCDPSGLDMIGAGESGSGSGLGMDIGGAGESGIGTGGVGESAGALSSETRDTRESEERELAPESSSSCDSRYEHHSPRSLSSLDSAWRALVLLLITLHSRRRTRASRSST